MSGILIASACAQSDSDRKPRPGIQDRAAGAADRDPRLSARTTRWRSSPRSTTTRRRCAHRVAIKTSVIADDGKVVHTAEDERKSEELQGAKGGYGYATTIETKGLAPGRYVLRVEATTLLTDGGKAMRELEFRIR